MDLYRSADGEGRVLRLIGNGPRRTVLTGNVRRGSMGSDGVTTFQAIDGADFGRVNSRLTTPKFFVDEVTSFIHGKGVKTASVATTASGAGTVHVAGHRLFARKHNRHRHFH